MFSSRRVALLLILAFAGCSNSGGPPVKITVPLTYRGEFRIIESPEGRDVSLQGGAYCFVIPKNGNLFVKSLAPFHQFHVETIIFDDGTIPKFYDHPAKVSGNPFAVFGGRCGYKYPDKRQMMFYFVGTASEASKFF